MNINEIANLAAKTKKPNKKDAFGYVKRLIDGENNEVIIANLYAFFLPPVPAKPKTPEQWVAKAVAKKDIRDYLNYMYSDGSRLIGCNAHRLHIYKTDKYPKGYYDTSLNRLDDIDYKYPDVDRTIIDDNPCDMPDLNIVVSGNNHTYDLGDVSVQKQYFDQAMSGLDNPIYHFESKDRAIKLTDSDKTAVIMPIRV